LTSLKVATIAVVLAWSMITPARSLTPDTFAVDSGSYRVFSFEVPRFGRVFGQFRSQGGDIRVLIVDQDQFENYRGGRPFRSYYDSGQGGGAQVDLQLRYGRYVLIFDNRAGTYSNRTVSSNLQLDES